MIAELKKFDTISRYFDDLDDFYITYNKFHKKCSIEFYSCL